jgi:hypothetical protein
MKDMIDRADCRLGRLGEMGGSELQKNAVQRLLLKVFTLDSKSRLRLLKH